MNDDPYEALGVGRDATPEEIQAAFKAKAKKAHPDAGGSTEEFSRVKNASLVLLDADKRRRFDEDGIVDDNKPDNRQATAMERIATFFINSINATLEQHNFNQALNLDDLDLVKGARDWFNQNIQDSNTQIYRIERQTKQFDRALKRLKKKGSGKDALRTMIEHHKMTLTKLIGNHRKEIELHKLSLTILEDYSFEEEQQKKLINPYLQGPTPQGGFWR